MRKGFTLIELLAVIVILAVIAVIAVPIVLNIINDSKESATLRSAQFYLSGVENEIMLENMKQGGSFNPIICEIKNSVLSCDGKEINLKMNGEMPSNGSITFESGKIIGVNLKYKDNNVIMDDNNELIFAKTLSDLAVVSTDLGINNIDNCIKGRTCALGTAFAIKVNDTKTYKFNVLKDEGNVVTLISADNFGIFSWYIEEEGCEIKYEDLYNDGTIDEFDIMYGGHTICTNTYGPITALKGIKKD